MAIPSFKRNIEAGTIYIPLWHTGLITQRSPLFTPISSMGVNIISRYDTLFGGLNMELSLASTLVRRPGFPKFCEQQLGASSWPLTYYSYKNLSGTIVPMMDAPDAVYTFTPTTLTELYAKGTTNQTSFQTVGDILYMVDGVAAQRWDGTLLGAIGIVTPTVAPTGAIGAGALAPPGTGYTWVYSYGSSLSGHVSTASPQVSIPSYTNPTVTETQRQVPVYQIIGSGSFLECAVYSQYGVLPVGSVVTIAGAPASISYLNGKTFTIAASSSSGFSCTYTTHTFSAVPSPGATATATSTVTAGLTYAPLYGPTLQSITSIKDLTTSTTVASADYSFTGGVITFTSGVTSGDALAVTYTYALATYPTIGVTVSGPSSAQHNVDQVIVFRNDDGGEFEYYDQVIPNNLTLTAAANASGGTTMYTGTIAQGANALADAQQFVGANAIIAGFSTSANNGTFLITGATATTLTVNNASGAAETHAGTVNATTWSFVDQNSDSGAIIITGMPLDDLIEAPIDDSNDPPPGPNNPVATSANTFNLLVYNAGRLFAAVDNYVYFAGGPDVTYGNGNEAWPPANVFTFPGKVTAIASVSAGLLVFTASDMYVIYGTSTASFYSCLFQKNMGVANQNCVAQDGDAVYIFTTKRQLQGFTSGLTEIGFNIGDQLVNFNPTTSYLTLHRAGSDAGLFISDGSSNMFRCALDQTTWSTVAQVVGGAGCIASIETSTDNYTLLTGRTAGSGYILGRNTSVFEDQTTTYPCNAVVGSLILAAPGSTVVIDSLIAERIAIGSDVSIGVALNEVAGPFVNLPRPVFDPPMLKPSTTLISKRYYLKAADQPLSQQVRHMMVQVSFPSENFRNELLTLGLS